VCRGHETGGGRGGRAGERDHRGGLLGDDRGERAAGRRAHENRRPPFGDPRDQSLSPAPGRSPVRARVRPRRVVVSKSSRGRSGLGCEPLVDQRTIAQPDPCRAREARSPGRGAAPGIAFEYVPVTAIVGAQWGDEGKGKITDLLAQEADVVIRFQGGNNAGHTVVNQHGTFKLHLVPSGIFNPNALCILGPGCVVDLAFLCRELADLDKSGISTANLRVSDRAHLVMPWHIALDRLDERERGRKKLGTTSMGVGPAYSDKVGRHGIQVYEVRDPKSFRARVKRELETKNAILERFGDAPLDDENVADGLLAAAGGEGPFPTELRGEEATALRERAHEYGATTGRPRRVGWFDAVAARHAHRLNAFTELAVTKLDVLDVYDRIPFCASYELDGKRTTDMPTTLVLEKARPCYETLE